jgi:hypothetical protein
MKRNCVNKNKEEKRRVGRCREREEGAWRRGGMNQGKFSNGEGTQQHPQK